MNTPEPMTGTLRKDVELIGGDPPMLFDRQADAYFRIDPEVLPIIAFLGESMPAAQFVERLNRNGIAATKEDVLQLLSFLQQNNLLEPEYGHLGFKRERQAEIREKTAFLRFSSAYLFFRLPPWRPEKFFDKIGPHVGWIVSKPLVILLLIPALIGYLLILRDFGAVRTTFLDSLSWAGLAKYFAAIVFLKFVHESAHSLAAIHFHCRVRGIGLGFMVFYPRFYTDTTDSWRLPRRQRLLIDAAGIIAELLLGGIAALLWTYLPPGAWKSTMFYIFAVGTVSTLFINGNPCIRYDGYYILCNLVNIENLMTRSGEYVRQFWRWHFLRLGEKPENERGVFLLCFGVSSFVYRFFLYTSIILMIYFKFAKALAFGMIVLELFSIVIYPFWREIITVRALSKRSGSLAGWYFAGALALTAALILFLPLSWNISLPGETVPAERRLVTVREGGYLAAPLKRMPRPVRRGGLLFELTSPQVEYGIGRMRGTLLFDQTLLGIQQVDEKQFSAASVTGKKVQSDRLSLAELLRRWRDLRHTAEADGVFVPNVPDLSANAFLPKGLMIGEIVSERRSVYAYASDRDVGKLRIGGRAVIRTCDGLTGCQARITGINPLSARLKNSPLLQQFGGPVPVYIEEGRSENYSSVLALCRVELEFEDNSAMPDAGRVVTVKISHTEQLYLRVRQILLSMFRKEF